MEKVLHIPYAEYKQMEEELEEQRKVLDEIRRAAPDNVVVVDYRECNRWWTIPKVSGSLDKLLSTVNKANEELLAKVENLENEVRMMRHLNTRMEVGDNVLDQKKWYQKIL